MNASNDGCVRVVVSHKLLITETKWIRALVTYTYTLIQLLIYFAISSLTTPSRKSMVTAGYKTNLLKTFCVFYTKPRAYTAYKTINYILSLFLPLLVKKEICYRCIPLYSKLTTNLDLEKFIDNMNYTRKKIRFKQKIN